MRSFGLTSAVTLLAIALLGVRSDSADAVIAQIYTFPFYDSGNVVCGFHCYYDPVYGWHEGTDYVVGVDGVGGEYIVAAAAGTALTCPPDNRAGNYIVIDHGNGQRTRYLHLQDYAIAYGPTVSAGQLIGHEGATGYTDPPGFYHLHFEARVDATTFTCGKDGTAVDPYDGSTYMWTTNPPSYQEGESVGVASWASNRLDVFVRGNNGQLYHRWWDGASWNPVNSWEGNHGGCLRGGPSAVSRTAPNRIDVFVRGCFDHLHRKSWNGSWSGYVDLGYCLRSEPAVTSWGGSRLDVFFRNCNASLNGYIQPIMVRHGQRRH